MNPDLDILAIEEEVETSRVIQVKMPYDNRLDVLKLVASSLDRRIQLMVRFITHPREDVCHLRSPNLRIVLTGSKLPKNTAFMWMLDQDRIHGQMTTLVDERLVFRAHERSVASSQHLSLLFSGVASIFWYNVGEFGGMTYYEYVSLPSEKATLVRNTYQSLRPLLASQALGATFWFLVQIRILLTGHRSNVSLPFGQMFEMCPGTAPLSS